MGGYRLLWGDLHNHNELGYAQGSLQRSYEIARSHLDFYAFTPHGQHADGGVPGGYPIVNSQWGAIRAAARRWNTPGMFTAFMAYEWHSKAWGHVHVVHPGDCPVQPLVSSLAGLQAHYQDTGTILVPHHTAYVNGVDWDLFDERLSPVVEMFSEHGCSERDTGPFPMHGHSGGPGAARFTAQGGLALGKRFGFVAGTDSHDGYPGAYGQGLTGVWAEGNSRAALLKAIRARRTVAVTGDRISLKMDGMGQALPRRDERVLGLAVEGWDFIQQVEVVKNNRRVWAFVPEEGPPQVGGERRYRLRLEWGWGPMKGYQLYDWEFDLEVEDGLLAEAVPCFASDPFDEGRRKRLVEVDGRRVVWQSHTSRGGIFTSRNGATAPMANDALCLEVWGTEATRLRLNGRCQTHQSMMATATDWAVSPCLGGCQRTFSVGELLAGRQGWRLEEMPTWVVAHRAVPEAGFRVEGTYVDAGEGPAWYYLRVRQENGQMAWGSPVWFGG